MHHLETWSSLWHAGHRHVTLHSPGLGAGPSNRSSRPPHQKADQWNEGACTLSKPGCTGRGHPALCSFEGGT